jgi:hypothetical protein
MATQTTKRFVLEDIMSDVSGSTAQDKMRYRHASCRCEPVIVEWIARNADGKTGNFYRGEELLGTATEVVYTGPNQETIRFSFEEFATRLKRAPIITATTKYSPREQ